GHGRGDGSRRDRPRARPARDHLSRLRVRPLRVLPARRTDGVRALRVPRRPQGRRLRRAGPGAGGQRVAAARGDRVRGGRRGAARDAHLVARAGGAGGAPTRTDRAGPGRRQRRGQRGDPDRAPLRRPGHHDGRLRRQGGVRQGTRRRARRELPHARFRRGDEEVDRQARGRRGRRAHRRRHLRAIGLRADPARQAPHDRRPRSPLGPPRPAARLLEEPQDPRDQSGLDRRAENGPRPRGPGTAPPGRRPRVPAEGRARRRAARAGSQEQGEGPAGLVMLGALLARAALRRPDAEAVVDGRRRLTYAELDARAIAVARGFARLGVAHGARVLLVLRNRLEHVIAYWALQKLGSVAVPVNFRLAANELRYLLEDSGARIALFEDSTSGPMREAARGTLTDLVFVGDAPPTGSMSFDDVLGEG